MEERVRERTHRASWVATRTGISCNPPPCHHRHLCRRHHEAKEATRGGEKRVRRGMDNELGRSEGESMAARVEGRGRRAREDKRGSKMSMRQKGRGSAARVEVCWW